MSASTKEKNPPWPAWFPGFVVLGLVIAFLQGVSNIQAHSFKEVLKSYREIANNLGQYQRGWGMFGGSNTATSTVRLLFYSQGRLVDTEQVLFLRPGYRRVVWTEIFQDLQFDDNNDRIGYYRNHYLRAVCRDKQKENPAIDQIQMEQQMIGLYSITGARLRNAETNILETLRCD